MKKLDWSNIRKKHVQAYALMLEESRVIGEHTDAPDNILAMKSCDAHHATQRFLYDFFDSKNIFVNIVRKNNAFVSVILTKGRTILVEGTPDFGDFRTRPEAEVASWKKAFEILESYQ